VIVGLVVAAVEVQARQYWLVGTSEAGSVVVVVVPLVVVLVVVARAGGTTLAKGRTRCAWPLSVSD
jgi:hypothetical protein